MDSEGLVRMPDGNLFVSDEYGPFIYQFRADGVLQSALHPPAAIIPRSGGYPGRQDFTASRPPWSGRRNNRGFEGLTLSPDGKRLTTILQSPTVQDSGPDDFGRFTRLLQFDVDPGSARFGQVLSQFIYPLTDLANRSVTDYTVVSEVLAVGSETFLVLERDSFGLGSGTNLVPRYKRIVLASTASASNLAGTEYDLERGAPGHRSLASARLPPDLRPMARRDWIDLLDPVELARFGLNLSNQDTNTLAEKWEGLALVPIEDPEHPDDWFLLVGSDNDFGARFVVHSGRVVATNAMPVDTMVLAYRVTLPGYRAAVRQWRPGSPSL
jgi:hypothetical protein